MKYRWVIHKNLFAYTNQGYVLLNHARFQTYLKYCNLQTFHLFQQYATRKLSRAMEQGIFLHVIPAPIRASSAITKVIKT